jgi:hypothetical protein
VRTWPTVGESGQFRCVACEAPIVMVYAPGQGLDCPKCSRAINLPQLPSRHAQYRRPEGS